MHQKARCLGSFLTWCRVQMGGVEADWAFTFRTRIRTYASRRHLVPDVSRFLFVFWFSLIADCGKTRGCPTRSCVGIVFSSGPLLISRGNFDWFELKYDKRAVAMGCYHPRIYWHQRTNVPISTPLRLSLSRSWQSLQSALPTERCAPTLHPTVATALHSLTLVHSLSLFL